jgi:CubicO group peptidase (beta-lactamase class C family)
MSIDAIDIEGRVDDGYGPVADAFRRNFTEHGDVGAAFCLHVDGEPVVDIVGGMADEQRPYTRDTLQLVFSTTKGATAIVASILAQRGDLDVDAPVARYWPEFAAGGKDDIPVSWVLSHQAGLLHPAGDFTVEDVIAVEPILHDLAAMEPVWEPGTRHGYHAITYGWLMGEIVRRVTGKSLGTVFAEEVAGPLGLEFWIGLPPEHEHRVAPLRNGPAPAPELAELVKLVMGPGTLAWKALTINGCMDFADAGNVFNDPRIHATEMPAANGITNARSLSRMYAACIGEVDGVRLLTPEQMEKARTPLVRAEDAALMVESAFGLGFGLDTPMDPKLGPGSFGHAGAGGSLGFAHPETGIAFGYVMNQMGGGLTGDPRTLGLIQAVEACRGL